MKYANELTQCVVNRNDKFVVIHVSSLFPNEKIYSWYRSIESATNDIKKRMFIE